MKRFLVLGILQLHMCTSRLAIFKVMKAFFYLA